MQCRALCFAVLLAVVVQARADVNSIERALEARYQHARTLKAVFYERYSDGSGGISAESGTVYFSRPGRMRWEYESPSQKLFLVDGTNVWMYVPEDRTASHAKLKESDDWRTPLALLAGKADLSKLCRSVTLAAPAEISGAEKPQPGTASAGTVLCCIPRDDAAASGSPKDVLLELDSESHLTRVVIHQPGNAETEFRFGNWQENVAVPESKFHFQPPPGVSIVDEDSLTNQLR